MRKTSVYLTEEESRRLAQLAKLEQRSQAQIIRDAVAAYVPSNPPDREFLLFGSGRGDGTSIADVPEDELLEGFGG